ncbi:MAG TPA: glycolate oxidase subunit GlcF [Leucothrix mucor]|nr:glycolate oxidase subunit GlcF [Leucothrix mucor]
MKTNLTDDFKQTPEGQQADKILRSCVHCGFCNATCPTYQLLGDENDGPRGRIYLIKQMLEGGEVTEKTRSHLDRCLTCRNCETTCPSGVQYASLLEIGRKFIEEKTERPFKERFVRDALSNTLPYRGRFKLLLGSGRAFSLFVPKKLRSKMPAKIAKGEWPQSQHERRMLILDGCVQPALSPDINSATANVLDKLGITLLNIKKAGCCGAVDLHLSKEASAIAMMKRNIDAWWSEIEAGAEAIVTTASGCGVMIKDYYHYLQHDNEYAEKARRIADLCKDIAEVIATENYTALTAKTPKTISWHPPCTLQHGQKITGVVEKILTGCGYQLNPIQDVHLCCGSAGTYSILQPELSSQLGDNKIANLEANKPEMIVTANIGCQTHLQERTKTPVKHWIHLLLDD